MLKKFAIVFCLVTLSVPVAASAQSTLSVGQRIKTTANVNVRSKPTNAKKNVLCIQTTGFVGLYHHAPEMRDVRDYPKQAIDALKDAGIDPVNTSWASQCMDVRLAEWGSKAV